MHQQPNNEWFQVVLEDNRSCGVIQYSFIHKKKGIWTHWHLRHKMAKTFLFFSCQLKRILKKLRAY